jgi:hypothetical protein
VKTANAATEATAQEPDVSTSNALTKITVNLVPRAAQALDTACAVTKDSKTDTINRALQLYALMTSLMDQGWDVYLEQEKDDVVKRERVWMI